MSTSKSTTDHETIQRWVEERGGTPSQVIGTGDEAAAGILRIDFPGYGGQHTLEPISWHEFFEKFEDARLALMYQERTDSGELSYFNKLVRRDA